MRSDLIFLEIAKEDLRAAKCLLNEKLYPQSIFYIQQAIEKATKSLGIYNRRITESEAKSTIGHEAWRLYEKIFYEEKKKMVELKESLNKLPRLKEGRFRDLTKKLDEWDKAKWKNITENYNAEYMNLFDISFSREELEAIINEINRLRTEKIALQRDMPEAIGEEELKDFRGLLHELLDAISEAVPNFAVEEVEKELSKAITPQLIACILKLIKKLFSRLIYCLSCLFYLSLIFSPHVTRARYPEDNSNPLEIYNNELPLVQKLNYFIEVTEEVLTDLDYILHLDLNREMTFM
jgi:HEPN domain-containing protein